MSVLGSDPDGILKGALHKKAAAAGREKNPSGRQSVRRNSTHGPLVEVDKFDVGLVLQQKEIMVYRDMA